MSPFGELSAYISTHRINNNTSRKVYLVNNNIDISKDLVKRVSNSVSARQSIFDIRNALQTSDFVYLNSSFDRLHLPSLVLQVGMFVTANNKPFSLYFLSG
jgi:hypothetical protein